MPTDRELLESYAQERSEAALTELVTRHINVVYSAALRETCGDAAQAADITQAVFLELARKAVRLAGHPALAGWLYTCVRNVAANIRRADQRRQRRELEAHTMNELHSAGTAGADWRQVQPVLDDAMHELSETDRAAVVLRYFEDRSHKEVGLALGLAESAARMRVERALERLRVLLAKRGITSTASGLAAALAVGAATSVPSGLAAGVTATALAGASASGGTTLTLLKLMSMTKIKVGMIGVVVAASAVTSVVIEQNSQARIRAVDESLRQQAGQIAKLAAENGRLAQLGAQAKQPDANNEEELARLRKEAALLRERTNELVKLREENGKIRAKLQPPGSKSALEAKEERMMALSYGKQLGLALLQHAMGNENQIATNFDQARKYLPIELTTDTNFVSDQFEIVFRGYMWPLTNDPSRTILLRERKARQLSNGQWLKIYVFIDGSGKGITAPDGNFEAYEKQNGGPTLVR